MRMKRIISIFLFIICTFSVYAGDISGIICDESDHPIEIVTVTISTLESDHLIAATESRAKNGRLFVESFEVHEWH